MNAYALRDRLLLAMGFPSYMAYLRSPLWVAIRTKQLTEHPDCFGCGSRAQEVHHGNYRQETLLGGGKAYLFSICKRCHRAIEFSAGKKVSLSRTVARLQAIRKAGISNQEPSKERKPTKLQREVLVEERRWSRQYARQLIVDDEP